MRRAAGTWVNDFVIRGVGCSNGLLDVFSGAMATVGCADADEPIQRFPVMGDALALIVGRVQTVGQIGPFVP